ncbi:MAG: MmgE/PrpD family protein, partial [Rhodospirillales bacterium]|nr:MmgE/PrpD family protein [Rhodospirillales bacterium]
KGPAFRHMAKVTVETLDGRSFTETVTHRKGSPENPLSAEAVIAKFDTLAGGVLGAAGVAEVKQRVFALDTADEVASLISALNPED